MNTSTLNDNPTAVMDVVQLAVAARKSYEQKRIKECLGLINQILLCDPGNSEAQALKAAVFSDVDRDIADARGLLADSQSRSDGPKYRKAAEIILLKILYLDPTYTEAKTLLATARASAERLQPVPVPVETPKPKQPMFEEVGFTAQPKPVRKKPEPDNPGIAPKLPILFVGFAVLAGVGLFLQRPYAAISAPAAEVAFESPAYFVPEPDSVATDAKAEAAGNDSMLAAADPMAISTQAEPGILAVNAPISAEIYMDGKYLGETPMTLQLPAGSQTLEYRHGDLRTVVTHDIKSKETINALVSFDVTVQLNARPWAQVFVDGTVRKPLGQTPLSSVQVPVGTVLAFENPNFPSKNYQITEKDSSIQVVFP